MNKKILIFLFALFSFIEVSAKNIIDYEWSFTDTNYNMGLGLNSVVVKDDYYYTWHIDYDEFVNTINKYDEEGNLVKIYEPAIEEPIVDLIYYDNNFIAIDRHANFYKLDDNLKVIKKVLNDEDYISTSSMSELKISNNTIYYIDKSDFTVFYTDYSLDKVKSEYIGDTDTLEEILELVPFISPTDQMYFKYLIYLYETAPEDSYYELSKIIKKDNKYYITGFYQEDNGPSSFIRLVDEDLNTLWNEESKSMSISLSISFYNDYMFVLYIAPGSDSELTRYIRIYDKDNNFISEETIPSNYEDNIPIAIIPDNNGIVIKSLYHNIAPQAVASISYPEIIIDKYSINIFKISTITDGNGTITVNPSAIKGDKVTFATTPNENYILDTITVTDSLGNIMKLTNNSFIMPEDNVTIKATFTVKNPETEDQVTKIITISLITLSIFTFLIIKSKRKYLV